MNHIEKTIRDFLENKFLEKELNDCYLVDLHISGDLKIDIFVDSDSGMTIDKCGKINRSLNTLLMEKLPMDTNFGIEVSSPGIGKPLINRQYKKNIGRNLHVRTQGGEIVEGILGEVNENGIVMDIKVKKEIEKKIINFDEIAEGKIFLKFNTKNK